MANKVFGIRLDPRQAWAWQRLGNAQIRELIAPGGVCVQCGTRPTKPQSRNGWFCYPCQDRLDQQDLLPKPLVEALTEENRLLRAELAALRTKRDAADEPMSSRGTDQLSLFRPEA